ncbi:unnamed protein product [Euphydryas editha]|uniref:Uncharacterized protein n=1 Tax=Euphydryas editha TaxID=104508 RepID=A0AAU9U1G3_EUPED|nr:unnamed protein product [Euphydryas editha]
MRVKSQFVVNDNSSTLLMERRGVSNLSFVCDNHSVYFIGTSNPLETNFSLFWTPDSLTCSKPKLAHPSIFWAMSPTTANITSFKNTFQYRPRASNPSSEDPA